MKIIRFVGSARKGGNTDVLVSKCLEGASEREAETEKIYLHDLTIKDCVGDMACKAEGGSCFIQDDMQPVYEKIRQADGVVLGSPIYMGYLTGQTKSFLDRWFAFLDANRVSRLPNGKKAVLVFPQGQPDGNLFAYVSSGVEQVLKLLGITEIKTIVAPGVREKGEVSKNEELLSLAMKEGSNLARPLDVL